MYRVFTIPKPNVKLYFVEGCKFSTDIREANVMTMEDAMKVQNIFVDLDIQIEEVK